MPFKKPSEVKATSNKPHLIVEAGPGTGKTTTMIAGLHMMQGKEPEWFNQATDEQIAIWESMYGSYRSIAFQAFNKSIATEIQKLVPKRVKASTFHSFGYSVLRDSGLKVKTSQINDQILVKNQMGYEKNDRMDKKDYEKCMKVCKFISLLKNNLLQSSKSNILNVANHNGIGVDDDVDEIEELASYAMVTIRNEAETGSIKWISFDDMLWLPIMLGMDFGSSKVDLLICDESQDLNAVQHEMVIQSASRLICVGDPRQAIYGFRGADAKSIDTIEKKLAATERGVQRLPLLTSFRLPISGVENVSSFAPGLRARNGAPKGKIINYNMSDLEVDSGDLVVSRINANIFSLAFRLLKMRTPVRIEGRDFGKQLINILKNNSSGESISEVANGIQMFDVKERVRLEKKQFSEKLIDAHDEKMSCLYSLMDGCESLNQMISTIEDLFDNDIPREEVVLLSTIHRAKGLEADRVLFLEPGLVPHPMAKLEHERTQEYNLKFVAETRHKETLVYVHEDSNEDDRDDLMGID